MKLLVDENLPYVLAHALHAVFSPEHQIVALRDKFGRPGVTDEEWMEVLGAEGGWTVLSGDINIVKKRPSRALFNKARLIGFFPVKTVMEKPLHLKVARILTIWHLMVKQVALVNPGAAFEITERGEKFRQVGS